MKHGAVRWSIWLGLFVATGFDRNAVGHQFHALNGGIGGGVREGRGIELGWERVDHFPTYYRVALLVAEPDVDVFLVHGVDLDGIDPIEKSGDDCGRQEAFLQGNGERIFLLRYVHQTGARRTANGRAFGESDGFVADAQPGHLREEGALAIDLDFVVVNGKRVAFTNFFAGGVAHREVWFRPNEMPLSRVVSSESAQTAG